jgi:hypothetical protein
MRKVKIKPNAFIKYFKKRQGGPFVVEEPKKLFGADHPLYIVSEYYFEKKLGRSKRTTQPMPVGTVKIILPLSISLDLS